MLKAIKIVITTFFANRRSLCPFPNSVFSVLSTFPVTCYVTNLVVFHNSTFQFQLMARFFTFRRIFDQWVLCTISSSFPNVVRCFFALEIYVLSTLASYQIVKFISDVYILPISFYLRWCRQATSLNFVYHPVCISFYCQQYNTFCPSSKVL